MSFLLWLNSFPAFISISLELNIFPAICGGCNQSLIKFGQLIKWWGSFPISLRAKLTEWEKAEIGYLLFNLLSLSLTFTFTYFHFSLTFTYFSNIPESKTNRVRESWNRIRRHSTYFSGKCHFFSKIPGNNIKYYGEERRNSLKYMVAKKLSQNK